MTQYPTYPKIEDRTNLEAIKPVEHKKLRAMAEQMTAEFDRAARLSDMREDMVLTMLLSGIPQVQIAQMLNIGRSRVSQIIKSMGVDKAAVAVQAHLNQRG